MSRTPKTQQDTWNTCLKAFLKAVHAELQEANTRDWEY